MSDVKKRKVLSLGKKVSSRPRNEDVVVVVTEDAQVKGQGHLSEEEKARRKAILASVGDRKPVSVDKKHDKSTPEEKKTVSGVKVNDLPQDDPFKNSPQKPSGPKKVTRDSKEKEVTFKEEREVKLKKMPNLKRKKLSVTEVMMMGDDDELMEVKQPRGHKKKEKKGDAQVVRQVKVPESITVQELSVRLAKKVKEVMKVLSRMGLNDVQPSTNIDSETAELVVIDFGHEAKKVSFSEDEKALLSAGNEEVVELQSRAPVVVVMGHVDHGKTSILDAIKKSKVADKEAGGITQHIAAYQVSNSKGSKITFLDTPGHAAFSSMRARGVNLTDIVVLVIAADDSIMPQTIESIGHAKAATIPVVVAINKVDKEGANVQKVKNDLLQHDLIPEDLGGDTIVVEVSAKTGKGIPQLLDSILLQAEILELKADVGVKASGIIVESSIQKGKGVVATALVTSGVLKEKDIVIADKSYGKIKVMYNDIEEKIKEALPSTPVSIVGLDSVPVSGCKFSITSNEKTARDIIKLRKEKDRNSSNDEDAIDVLNMLNEKENEAFNIIVKTDVEGSIAALEHSIQEIVIEDMPVTIVHAGVGEINESDVNLAAASSSIILGFNVSVASKAKSLAKVSGVKMYCYNIIYELLDNLKELLEDIKAERISQHMIGEAEVIKIFDVEGTKIAGCSVKTGIVALDATLKIKRSDKEIFEGNIVSLKIKRNNVTEAKKGEECGIVLDNFRDISVGDIVEVYRF